MTFDVAAARDILTAKFAPWVLDLGIEIVDLDKAGLAILQMPVNSRISRDGGTVCGQASMALADTAMVFAVAAASGGYRAMTTVTQTTNFVRALACRSVLARGRVVKLGRTLAFGEVVLSPEGSDEIAVQVATTYALLGPVE
ncbi:MAG: hotdog fold thioesterase [Alphaproteobacteria bacterium]|nr:hotdog fold thioesterase [Alphaproteobacteria bacterium]